MNLIKLLSYNNLYVIEKIELIILEANHLKFNIELKTLFIIYYFEEGCDSIRQAKVARPATSRLAQDLKGSCSLRICQGIQRVSSALLFELIEPFEHDLFLALVVFNLLPKVDQLELATDDDGLFEGVLWQNTLEWISWYLLLIGLQELGFVLRDSSIIILVFDLLSLGTNSLLKTFLAISGLTFRASL